MKSKIPFFRQETDYSCGLASMRMLLGSLDIILTEEELKKPMAYHTRGKAVWHKNFPIFAEKLKLNHVTMRNASENNIVDLIAQDFRVVVAYFIPRIKVDHYSVVNYIDTKSIYLFDPWFGPKHKYTLNYFNKNWHDLENEKGWLFGVKR